ncbi:MAG: hypothetical protein ACO3A2_11095 [Bdellovibrionia bacterium]
MKRQQAWEKKLRSQAQRLSRRRRLSATSFSQKSLVFLSQNPPPVLPKAILVGQPWDAHLLTLSRLYRKSRSLFKKNHGVWVPSFSSSARALSSDVLLTPRIEYSPIASELIWSVCDPVERKNPQRMAELLSYSTFVYHEQNHRVLWSFLPPCANHASSIRRYLNFAESLVVTLDLALSDELGEDLSALFYHAGVLYHPGTEARSSLQNLRRYKNYLHLLQYSTYLNLELYRPKEILSLLNRLYPESSDLIEVALDRSLRLDRKFIEKTNLIWQARHGKKLRNSSPPAEQLRLADDPLDHRLHYWFTEKWLSLFF